MASQPEWLPHSFSSDGGQLASVFVPRDQHDRLTFLNDQYFGNRFKVGRARRADVEAAAADAPQGPLHFIFHSAFCCSTLLARALTVPGRVMGLKEPVILNDLALRMGEEAGDLDKALLRLTLRLLARPFDKDGAVVTKASSVANRLIDPILDQSPQSRAVLLFSDLPSMLTGVAKQGLERRIWSRQLYVALSRWTSLAVARDAAAVVELADLPLAALVWLMQIRHFQQISATYGSDRVLMLNSADLLARPRETLAGVSAFLDLQIDRATIDAILYGDAFRMHSKRIGTAYSIADRNRDYAAVQSAHGPEIQAAIAWLQRFMAFAKAA